MNRTISARVAAILSPAMLLISCGSAPTGQVVAVVNGEEITLQELNAQISKMNLPAGSDGKQVRQQVIQQLIEQRLIAGAAKEEGLDREPTYIVQQRRMNEDLLVQMYGKKFADTMRAPDDAAITKFVAENPNMFGQRKSYLVDQISFDMPGNLETLKSLEADKTMADIKASLNRMGIKFIEGKNSIDSANVPPNLLAQILKLPAGEPFIVPAQGRVAVSVITGSQDFVVPQDQIKPMAARAMRAENLGKIMKSKLDEAKAKAKIEYQDGYAPPPKDSKSKLTEK